MRVSSTSANPRRIPQQARAAARREKFLAVAAALIGELGYDAVTMTAIAEQAGASIGTLYDYFPDKPSIGLALITQYTDEVQAHWELLLRDSATMTRTALADVFVEGALKFARERPAYLPLMGAPVAFQRTRTARRPLRQTVVNALRRMNSALPEETAFVRAEVIVQLIKGLLTLYREGSPRDRDDLAGEYKKVIRLYVMEILG